MIELTILPTGFLDRLQVLYYIDGKLRYDIATTGLCILEIREILKYEGVIATNSEIMVYVPKSKLPLYKLYKRNKI